MALNNLGVALQQVRRFKEAALVFQQAAQAFRDSGDRHGEGIALGSLGNLTRHTAPPENLIDGQGATQYLDSGGQDGADAARYGRIVQPRRFTEAITALQDGAQAFRSTGDRHGEGRAQENLGIILREAGRLTEAIATLQEAAQIFRDTGDQHSEGIALSNLGVTLHEAGRLTEAIAALQEAAQIFRDTGDQHSEKATLRAFTNAAREMLGFTKAFTADLKARRIQNRGASRRREGLGFDIPVHALCESGREETLSLIALQRRPFPGRASGHTGDE